MSHHSWGRDERSENAMSKPREFAISWNPDEIRDLRDGVPIEPWEIHVIEKSAYDELLKANANCISLSLHESRMAEAKKAYDELKGLISWLRDGLDHIIHEDYQQAQYLIQHLDETIKAHELGSKE